MGAFIAAYPWVVIAVTTWAGIEMLARAGRRRATPARERIELWVGERLHRAQYAYAWQWLDRLDEEDRDQRRARVRRGNVRALARRPVQRKRTKTVI